MYIITDTYRDGSIKSGGREKSGSASKVIIASVKSKLPRDMNQFMLDNKNKTQFIQLIFAFVKTNLCLVLQDIFQTDCVMLSGDNNCCLVQLRNVKESYHLTSNQEEADTKVVLHSMDVLNSPYMFIYLRLPSGDTNILILALDIIRHHKERVFYDYGNGDHRRSIWLSSLEMDENHRDALNCFHSFTGTDYTSTFFS